jgi:GTP-binding protein
MERDDRLYRLIDTAGLRRKSKVEEAVEKFSIVKTLAAIEECQVAVVMLDAGEGVTDQDASVLGYALDAGPCLGRGGQQVGQPDRVSAPADRKPADSQASFVEWAEKVRISAKHGSGLRELVQCDPPRAPLGDYRAGHQRSDQGDGNRLRNQPAAGVRGHVAKMRFAHPGGVNPPTFIIHGTRLRTLADSYKRYLENFFRKRFKLVGTPVAFVFKEGTNPYEGKKNVLTERQVAKKRRMIRHVKRGSDADAGIRTARPCIPHSLRIITLGILAGAVRRGWAASTRPGSSAMASRRCCAGAPLRA